MNSNNFFVAEIRRESCAGVEEDAVEEKDGVEEEVTVDDFDVLEE